MMYLPVDMRARRVPGIADLCERLSRLYLAGLGQKHVTRVPCLCRFLDIVGKTERHTFVRVEDLRRPDMAHNVKAPVPLDQDKEGSVNVFPVFSPGEIFNIRFFGRTLAPRSSAPGRIHSPEYDESLRRSVRRRPDDSVSACKIERSMDMETRVRQRTGIVESCSYSSSCERCHFATPAASAVM